MDPFNTEKVKATHSRSRRRLLPFRKLQCSLVALTCALVCSTPLWLPKIGSFFLTTKVVFIIGNLIIVVLVTATKLLSSKSSSIDVCCYDYEHVERSQKRAEGPGKLEDDEGERLFTPAMLRDPVIGEEDEQVMDGHGKGWGARVLLAEEENLDDGDDSDDGEGGDPAMVCVSEDLNRRADEFIERVNFQRRLELSLLDHCHGLREFTQTY